MSVTKPANKEISLFSPPAALCWQPANNHEGLVTMERTITDLESFVIWYLENNSPRDSDPHNILIVTGGAIGLQS